MNRSSTYRLNNLTITLNKEGCREYAKVSYPIRYGLYSEIKTSDYLFQFNLNGEIKFIQGLGRNWPDPLEWLKRTVGNDWVYYSTGGYSGMFDAFGEHYLPCLSYPSNAITIHNPFDETAVGSAIQAWHGFQSKSHELLSEAMPRPLKHFLTLVNQNDAHCLRHRSRMLHHMIGERVSVLPPDTRHVDYEVIPVTVADGCLYKCGFCRVKSSRNFALRTQKNIRDQINQLKEFYGQDIANYNSLFLGQHDALNADQELLLSAAMQAYEKFEFDRSNMRGANLFLFGSVDSLLNAEDALFDRLERLPYFTYINIGLESADPETLTYLNKSIPAGAVSHAFAKALEINRRYQRIVTTVNFLFGEHLPQGHLNSVDRLIHDRPVRPYGKGALYFSPLVIGRNQENRGIKRKFYKIRTLSPIPAYIYLIQRL